MPPKKHVAALNDYGIGIEHETARADQIAILEESLQDVTDKRLQERFYFVTAVILLLDVLLLIDCPLYLGFFIVIVEAPILLSLAEKWGVEQIGYWTKSLVALIHKYFDMLIAKYLSKGDKPNDQTVEGI